MSEDKVTAKYRLYEKRKNGKYYVIKSGLSYEEALKIWRRKITIRKIEPDTE